ncbi:MAG TPA: thioredoxin domain-containing protein [Candidatus Binatus sp.]|nr:thioredoxin domain-containing protein [Candidatus Binatus sp.]
MRRTFLATLALGAVLGFVGPTARADDVVATVGDTKNTRAQLDDEVRAKLIELDNQRYDALREGLDGMIAQELLKREAAARGITVDDLQRQEIGAKVAAPTDEDIQKVYDENKAQLGGQTLEQIKPRIVEYLKGQKQEERRTAFIAELKKKYPTTISLKPPMVDVATAGRPERGPKNASVTIIEFSDYQCPFCKRAEDVVEQVMKTYDGKVRLVYRDYPLPFHPNARPASEAAACANAQGKFWEYHSKLFHGDGIEADKLKTYADQVGLDRKKFDECVDKKPFSAEIDKDVKDGEKAGVNGTPAFFINGRMLSGAQPYEKFKEIIDDELANAKKS